MKELNKNNERSCTGLMHNVAPGSAGEGEPGNYTGNSSTCKTCHPAQYALWDNTTHTSKLITRDDAINRGYPNPPGGYNWTNVSFAIGGKWKIRYVNDTGYIITNGGKNQFNVDDQVWTDYNPNVSKPYICGNCHNTGYMSNVTDTVKEPFRTLRAQGQLPGGGACATGGCHAGGADMIKTVHSIGNMSNSNRPTITVPNLSSSSVYQGTDVNVTATVNIAGSYAIVDGAQYRIMLGTTEVRSWTPMLALDGNFNGASEISIAVINTDIAPGNYTIEVRGMAGGPAQNTSERYYPINGDVSATNSTTLTVGISSMGYINGTVTSGGIEIEGVFVSISGVNDTSKSDGTYSLRVPEGTYTVNASRQPTHYDTSVAGVVVTPMNTTTANISIPEKPKGTISGTVRIG